MNDGFDGEARGPDVGANVESARRKHVLAGVLALPVAGLLAVWVVLASPGDAATSLSAVGTPPPARTASGPTTLALVTDIGNCDEGEAQVADMVDAWRPEAIASAGDNTQSVQDCIPYADSVDDYYREYTRGPTGPRFWPVLGNHDYDNEGAGLAAYQAYFSYLSGEADPQRRWYAKKVGSIHLFMLDSDAAEADLAAQRTWLRTALTAARAAEPARWNIVVFHRPAYSSGSHGQFTPMSAAAGWDYRGWGADIVVNGHQHLYEDVVVDGLHHVTAGVGASDIARPCPAERVAGSRLCLTGPGAIRVTATPARLLLEFHQPVGGSDVVKDVITLAR